MYDFSDRNTLKNVNSLKLKKTADLRPSLTSISVIYTVICPRLVDHYCRTECEISGKFAPCKFLSRGRGGDYGGRRASS